jgi:hypothetical protein
VPPTGAVKRANAGLVLDSLESFLCEFDERLATIVGSGVSDQDLDPLSASRHPLRREQARFLDDLRAYRRRVSWDLLAPELLQRFQRVNGIPGIAFNLRTDPPRSVPNLVSLPWLLADGKKEAFQALVNQLGQGFTLEPGQPWPPMVIEFDSPQRAVGIEFIAPASDGPAAGRYAAIAYRLEGLDASGTPIPTCASDASYLTNDERNNAGVIGRLHTDVVCYVGVRYELARIAAVRLTTLREREHNTNEPGPPIRTPPAIVRIWHEPLAPAALLQSELELVGPVGVPGATDGLSAPIKLPFAFDQAVVFLRGFRVRFLDQRPRAFNQLDMRVGDAANGKAQLTPNAAREVRLRIGGHLEPVSGDQPAYSVRAYFTVLAWDSGQVAMGSGNTDVILVPNLNPHGDPFDLFRHTYKLGVDFEDFIGEVVADARPNLRRPDDPSRNTFKLGQVTILHAGWLRRDWHSKRNSVPDSRVSKHSIKRCSHA